MIQPNELRRGNLVLVNGREYRMDNNIVPCRIWEIGLSGCSVLPIHQDSEFCDVIPIDLSGLIPIPLSGEWLLRLGLRKEGDFFVTTNWSGLFVEYNVDYGVQWYLKRNSKGMTIEISYGFEYVHQFQNLIFALTQEELKTTEL